MRILAITLALVACGKSSKPTDDQKGTADEAPSSSAFDCSSLLKADEVEVACGGKGSFSRTPAEGKTETVGNATLKQAHPDEAKNLLELARHDVEDRWRLYEALANMPVAEQVNDKGS